MKCVSFDHEPTENELIAVASIHFSIFFLKMVTLGMSHTIQSMEIGREK